jgi:PAS domain S-box-containing protein
MHEQAEGIDSMTVANSLKPAWGAGAPDEPVAETIRHLPVAYTEIDTEGIIRVANDAACRLHEMRAEEMVGHSILEFIPADEAEHDWQEFLRVLHSAEEVEPIRRSLYTNRGGYRSHELHRRVMRNEAGSPLGIASVTVDISELEAATREVKQAKLWLEGALAAISQAVVVTDALGFVRYLNAAAERLTGWQSPDLMGRQFEKGMPILKAVSKSGKPLSFRMTLLEPWHGDVELLTRERQTVAVWLSASPIVDPESGYKNGVVIVLGTPKAVAAPAT